MTPPLGKTQLNFIILPPFFLKKKSNVDKARLLMLYIIWKENNVGEEEKQKLIGHAKLPNELRDAVNNLTVLGVKQQRVKRQERMSFMKKRRERKRNDEERPYELSRYVPIVKKVLDVRKIPSP